ncbi:hypothetical protein TNCV_3513481 [Trichonephila clavipes]|nr:hypothetical protein TNCV_3513481 [Trichonephila clavipes]
MGQLTKTVRHRIGRSPTDGYCASYPSGCMEGEYAGTTNQLSNTWTRARMASTRQQCKRHGMKDIQEHVLQNKCLCVKRVWPMRRRVNLTSVLRSGITGHAPMTGFTECSLLSNC